MEEEEEKATIAVRSSSHTLPRRLLWPGEHTSCCKKRVNQRANQTHDETHERRVKAERNDHDVQSFGAKAIAEVPVQIQFLPSCRVVLEGGPARQPPHVAATIGGGGVGGSRCRTEASSTHDYTNSLWYHSKEL